jgi:hypothetical protein
MTTRDAFARALHSRRAHQDRCREVTRVVTIFDLRTRLRIEVDAEATGALGPVVAPPLSLATVARLRPIADAVLTRRDYGP